MSMELYAVRFSDGRVRYGVENTTVGHYTAPLFETPEQAWAWRHDVYEKGQYDISQFTKLSGEPVEVCDLIGTVFRAHATSDALVTKHNEEDREDDTFVQRRARPGWAKLVWN